MASVAEEHGVLAFYAWVTLQPSLFIFSPPSISVRKAELLKEKHK